MMAPAKINLFLQVLGRRDDGFHEIHSLMQAIDLSDHLEFTRIDSGFQLTCSDPEIPTDATNLVAKAWKLMRNEFNLPGGMKVRLTKRIPAGAGLGGGSSDAATTIKAVSRLFRLKLTKKRMMQLGSSLGSDVPFFFSSGCALAEGRGEKLIDVDAPRDYYVLLVIPDFRIETKLAFDAMRNFLTNYSTKSSLISAISGANFFDTLNSIGNDFQTLVCNWHPEVETAIKVLLNAGAPSVALSGSGSAFFALFNSIPESNISEYLVECFGWQVFECMPIRLES